MADAKIKFTAEDATGAAFAAVTRNVTNLKSELTLLPAKFAQIAIASAGIGSIVGFAGMIGGAIEAKARLRDLSVQTNISVEGLASLAKVGKYGNTSLDEIAAGSNKLSKSLFSQTEESKGAAQAVAALGLNFDKFKSQSPEQQFLAVAKALETFSDTEEKGAVAQLLYGKSGATLLPFLKELAERGLQVTKQTTEQAKAAKEYEDNLVTLKAAGDEWKKTLANGMLPTLLEFSRELIAGREAYGGWWAALFGIALTNPFNTLEENATKAREKVKSLESELANLNKGGGTAANVDMPGTLGLALAGRSESVIQAELDSARKRADYFSRVKPNDGNATGDFSRLDRKPRIKLPGVADIDKDSDGRALLKKQFEGQLKLIHDFAEQQKDGYEFANQYLKGVYDDGVTSLSDFFEKQRAIRDEALKAQVESFDKTIAEAEAYKSNPLLKPEARQDAENRIQEAIEKRAAAVQKASQVEILANQDNARAVKQNDQAYKDLQATVAGLRGDQAGSDAIRTAREIQTATEQLTRSLGPEKAKAAAEGYGELLAQTRALGRAQSDYSRLVEEASIKEQTVTLEAQASGASELDTLTKITAIRKEALTGLAEQAQRYRDIAAAIGSPENVLAAQKITLALRQAMAEAEPLFLRVRELGKEAGAAVANDAEEALLHWQGLRSVLSAVEQDILRIVLRSQVTKPFGDWLGNQLGGNGTSAGGGGWLGNIFSSLFGGGGGAVNLGTSSASIDAAVFGGWFADGGTLQPGQWGIAGENGPEKIYAGAAPLHVSPNEDRRGAQYHVTVNVPETTNRRSADQIGVEVYAALVRANRRKN